MSNTLPPQTNIDDLYRAYAAGEFTDQEAARFKGLIDSGKITVPEAIQAETSQTLPAGVWEAYASETMRPEERLRLQSMIEAGTVHPPAVDPSLWSKFADLFSGSLRSTPEIEALPDWTDLPELSDWADFSNYWARLGTLLTDKGETAQILKARFPNLDVRFDESGNPIFKSAVDEQEYAYKPGLQSSDIPRFIGGMAAFSPAGRGVGLVSKAAGAAATQSAIEATQVVSGGEANYGDIAAAGVLQGTGDVAGRLLSSVGRLAGTGWQRLRGRFGKEVSDELQQAAQNVSQTSRRLGSEKVAQDIPIDRDRLRAAQELGIEDYLDIDQLTTSQSFRELAQAAKSTPTSKTRTRELENMIRLGDESDELIRRLGGTTDLSTLDATVRNDMQRIQASLLNKSRQRFDEISETINPRSRIDTTSTRKYLEQYADELGGQEYLTGREKRIFDEFLTGQEPTYGLLDERRKEITRAINDQQGVFKDLPKMRLGALETAMLADQRNAARSFGVEEAFTEGRALVAQRKQLESNMTALFSRQLEKTMLPQMQTASRQLAKGDVSTFNKIMKAVPDDMRPEVAVSTLTHAMGKAGKDGSAMRFPQFADWYGNLKQNKTAYDTFMKHLPPESTQQLDNLYKVAQGIRQSSRERITTGRIVQVEEALKRSEGALKRLYFAVTAVPIVNPVISSLYLPTYATRKSALRALDDMLISPSFRNAVLSGSRDDVEKLARSTIFKKWVARTPGIPADKTVAAWTNELVSAMQAAQNIGDGQEWVEGFVDSER